MAADDEARELKRKEDELDSLLEELKQKGMDTASNRNRARSLTEIEFELGRYKDKPPKWVPNKSLNFREWSPEKNKDFAIGTRRDGLHTRYNSDTILTRIKGLERVKNSLVRIELEVMLCLIILTIICLTGVFDIKLPGLS